MGRGVPVGRGVSTGALVGLGNAVGVDCGLIVAAGVGVFNDILVSLEASEDGLGSTFFTAIRLKSNKIPHTAQVRCSAPSVVVVGSSTVVQSVAI